MTGDDDKRDGKVVWSDDEGVRGTEEGGGGGDDGVEGGDVVEGE